MSSPTASSVDMMSCHDEQKDNSEHKDIDVRCINILAMCIFVS